VPMEFLLVLNVLLLAVEIIRHTVSLRPEKEFKISTPRNYFRLLPIYTTLGVLLNLAVLGAAK